MNITTPRAKTITYKARVADVEYGVIRSVTTHFVTLARDHSGNLSAIVDGENMNFVEASRLLDRASQVEKIEEVILPAPAPIGNPAAHQLHRTLGRLGYRNHYALASEVLGRTVTSLAALTAEDAATVRSYAFGQLGLETELAA
ncbi:hypothetical protein [Deinococcus hopiensis]|uniref:Uncharacterized protein n=1 Tax=Deinococcus hopiensis KR-140 TaxID=695939 RepID=A0A1W1VIJ0_9DEIO|nr:hypothetical protein [Deinococcus hopiensis]SMB93199.1 hypothetical protein SAMN00790413_01886 [Deinococcus hopiensis KR-140]